MTVRVVVAVGLTVALLAVTTPGIQAARERAAVSAVDADVERLRAAVAAMASAPRGSRRVVALSVPAASVGRVRVAVVRVSARAVRYRLASGRRGGRRLPAAARVVVADGGIDGDDDARDVLAFDAPGTYRVAVVATADGVRVRPLDATSARAIAVVAANARTPVDHARAAEGLNDGTRPGAACSTVVASAGVRRPSTGTCSAWTRAIATPTAT